MALSPRTRFGPYELIAQIGAGGMGEVYKANDTNLKRVVAIKVLPASVAADAERLARFQREAEILAAFNHSNIAQIHGLEKSDGITALVMELVEGEDLAQIVARGGIPIDEALPIARQIADALDAAHERGIIHRDLKPANIMVRSDGTVKILDFGLARDVGPGRAASNVSQAPTITALAMTAAGTMLGTPAYMSPEQVRGRSLDRRGDIWAFGCVCFEMLTGQPAFRGETLPDTIAAILEREPDWKALPASTPSRVRRLLVRCLEKDPKRRLRDIGDGRPELGAAAEESMAADLVAPGRVREYAGWVVASLLLVGGAAVVLWNPWELTPVVRPVMRTAIVLPATQKLASGGGVYPMAISSDGARLAYVGEVEGRSQLYVRELDGLEPTVLPGTSGAAHPFFSPDGQWVGFFAGGALQKAPVLGGPPLRICNVPGATRGATWGPDDTIVLALLGAGLHKVDASGGILEPIAGSTPGYWPELLPDGRTVLYTTGVAGEGAAFAAVSVDGRTRKIVARTTDFSGEGPALLGTGSGVAQARFVSSGYLVYGQSPGIVRAIPFDVGSLTPTGSPIPLVDSVERARNGGGVYFVVSRTGVLVSAATGDRHELVWVDRNGTATPITTDRQAFRNPRVSPDGTRIAVAINDETRRSDIWVYDADRGTRSRLTTTGHNLAAVWTPTGTHVTFASQGLVQLAADGTGTKEVLLPLEQVRTHLSTGTNAYPTSWSPDGRNLVFQADAADLWVLPRDPKGAPRPLFLLASSDHGGQFSPDGRWLAYGSDESGRDEVLVADYPDLRNKVTISTEGGTDARWSRDGRELYYRQGDALMAVPVDTARVFRAGKPHRLFSGQFSGTGRETGFDVAPDGKRFVMIRSDEASMLRHLTVTQNWFDDPRRGSPSK